VNAKSGSGSATTSPTTSPTTAPTTSPTTAPTTSPATVSATFNEYATTTTGTNVYVVGNVSALGNWDPASAVALSSSGYPIWSGTVTLPAGTAVEYKYIKKDSSGNVTWESNANRTITTGTAAVTYNNSWNVANAGATAVTFNETATTTTGTNVYVVGSIAALGAWDTSAAIPLSSSAYPTWSRQVIVPQSTTFEYKYIRKDSSGTVTWESGSNRSYTTGTAASYSTSDSWK
jgi:alpha-amylase